jgi:O-methyltransferase
MSRLVPWKCSLACCCRGPQKSLEKVGDLFQPLDVAWKSFKGDPMDDINQLRINYKKEGYALLRYDDGPVHSYPYDSPWITDEAFSEKYNKIRHNTLVDRPRCYSLYLLMDQIRDVPGDILEVGTWRGGTGALFALTVPEKKVYLADTFTGVVKSAEWEHYKDKAHDDTSEQLVRDFTVDLGLSNTQLLTGIFPEDTGERIKDKKLSFVYLDLDVYESTKDAFNYVWGNLSQHGIVAFDDYGMISACVGISKFVDEIRNDPEKIFIQNLNGQAYIIKK